MSTTSDSAKTGVDTKRELYGQNYYPKIGSKGGKAKNPNKGFGSSRKQAQAAGRKGGTASSAGSRIVPTQ